MSGSKRARLRNWWQQITKGSPSEKEDQQSNLSDNNEPDPVNGAPSSGKYILSATKQTLAILRGVAGLVPFPGVKEAVDLGLIVIETCEGISEVRGQVSDLEDRIISVLLVVAKVAKEQQLSSESQPSAAHSTFLQDVTELSSCFKDILKKLKDIREQKTWIVAVMQRDNKDAIQGCIDDFQFALARFQMLRSLYMDQNFSEIRFQLESIYDLNKAMADDLTVVRQDVQFIRTKLDQTTSEKPSSSFLIMDVPPIPRIFFGRDAFVDRVATQLTSTDSNNSRICILGPGGMGKTSVATAIVNSETVKERFAHNRYWVSCISANSPSNFLSILCQSLSMKGQIKDTEDIRSITQAVREDNKPHLIVLDNFETTWHPVEGRQRTIQDILEALDALPNIAILVTMRSELPPIPHWKHEKLPNLQSEDSRRIYAAIDEECEGTPEELNELLKALGHLPYAVTLMATRAKASYASPAQLLEEWNEAGPTMISTTEDGMDHSIRLSVNSKFVRDSAGALRLLQVLSMLPEGVDRRELSIWIKDSKTEALDTLRKAALVQTSTTVVDGARKVHLFVLPVVQSYMAQGDRIPKSVREQVHKACFDFLSDHKDAMETPDNKGFRDAFAAIYSQEANLHSLLVSIVKTELEKEASDDSASSSRQSATSNNQPIHVPLITYVWFLRWSKPKSEIMKNILRLAKETNDVRSEAEITKALKEVLGGWGNRKTNMRTATEQFESLGDYRKAVVTDFRSIRYHNWQMRDEKATNRTGTILAKLEDARKKWEAREAYRKDSCIKALVLYYCSSIWLFFPKRCPEFIDDLLEAKKIFTRLDMQYHAGLCASHLAKRYLYLERDEDALKGNEEALESFKAVAFGESGMAEDIGDAYFWKAKILKRLDQWDNPDLIEALESALKIYRDVLGFHGKTGRMWEELGEINVQRKEWKEARAAYQTACEFGERAGLVRLKTQKRMPRWQNNIKYINAKEANPADDSVEFKPPPRVS